MPELSVGGAVVELETGRADVFGIDAAMSLRIKRGAATACFPARHRVRCELEGTLRVSDDSWVVLVDTRYGAPGSELGPRVLRVQSTASAAS